MLACLDVTYGDAEAVAACVVFQGWTDASPVDEVTCTLAPPAEYVSGALYRRELPALLRVLRGVRYPLDTLIIDGHVWLGTQPGLGVHLHVALNGSTTVVGVAKSPHKLATTAVPVLRGRSKKPLWVTAQGMAPDEAAARLREMHGPYRIPTLLRRADALSRGELEG